MPLKKKRVLQIKNKDISSCRNQKKCSSTSDENVKRSATNSKRRNLVKKKNELSKQFLPEANISEMNLTLPYKDKEICAVLNCVDSDFNNKSWIILTHGAGGDLNTPQLKAISLFLMAKNFVVLRFTCKGLNIQYRVNVFHEILNNIDAQFNPRNIFIGGRSMGSRAAVTLLSQKLKKSKLFDKISAVICLSYPLHKVYETGELRDSVLLELKKPVFFLSGDTDEMCQKKIFEGVLKKMTAPYKVHWLSGYDHSAKSNSNFEEEAYFKAFNEIADWCQDMQLKVL